MYHVGTVQPAAKAGFYYSYIYTLLCKKIKSHSYRYLKERRLYLFNYGFMCIHKLYDPFFAYISAVYTNAFPEINKVGRSIQPGFITCFLQYGRQHMAGAA